MSVERVQAIRERHALTVDGAPMPPLSKFDSDLALADIAYLLDVLVQVEAERDALREALTPLLDTLGPCDHYDHHGDCQAHWCGNPCSVAIAAAVLLGERTAP